MVTLSQPKLSPFNAKPKEHSLHMVPSPVSLLPKATHPSKGSSTLVEGSNSQVPKASEEPFHNTYPALHLIHCLSDARYFSQPGKGLPISLHNYLLILLN